MNRVIRSVGKRSAAASAVYHGALPRAQASSRHPSRLLVLRSDRACHFSCLSADSFIGKSGPFSRKEITGSSARGFASLSESEIKKRLDEFQDLFVEARLCIEDLNESIGTKYFDADAEEATESVNEAVTTFEQLIAEIEDLDEKNRVLRGNGLKVEQLKGELDLALKGGHDH